MSEFSDSLHFYGVAVAQLRTRLRDRGIRAFILDPAPPIATLMGWEDKEKTRDIGASLDFAYGEDHGVYCKLYKGGALVGRLNVEWGADDFGPPEPPESPNFPGTSDDLAAILAADFFLSEDDANKVATITERYDLSDYQVHSDFVDELGSLLGLKHFRWRSCADLDHNMADLLETNPEGAVE